MNPKLKTILMRSQRVSCRALQSSIIKSCAKKFQPRTGKFVLTACLLESEILECFEYASVVEGRIQTSKYSYHWQNAGGALKQRWGNAPHYPDLPNAPHHIHEASENVRENPVAPNFFKIIEEIENDLSSLSD